MPSSASIGVGNFLLSLEWTERQADRQRQVRSRPASRRVGPIL